MDPITAILVNIIIGVVLSLASTLMQQAFAPKRPDQRRQTGTRGSVQFGGRVPQYFLIGTVGDAGKVEYQNAWGDAGGVPNAYLTTVYSFGDLPGVTLTGLYVNGVAEPISGSGHVLQGYPTTGDKAGHLWVEFFDGQQTVASAYLLGKFSADADRPWTSDMVGRGVPYLIATSMWAEGKWTGFPTFVGEFQGIPLYDPRRDDTAGGDGDQRWDDPSTWAFSDNNIVIIYNIERGIHYDGAKVWGGSSTAAQLPYAVWAAAMDACDEEVELDAGGTEKRFRAGRRISLNERPADVVKELLVGCNGRISHAADGTVYVLVGVPDEADGTFTDVDVLASEPLGTIPFPNLDEVINGATATYREPAQAWEDKETAPYYRSDLEAEDDGRRQVEGLDLGTTFSGTQAQRILKAVIEEGRRFRRHVVALPPVFAIYRPLSVLAWTSERFGYEAKLFLVTARTVSPWGTVVLGLQEIDPADHAWNPSTDEQPLSFAPVVINRPAPQPMTGFAVSPYIIVDSAAAPRRPAILVEFAGGLQDVRAVRIQAKLDGDIVFDGETPYDITEASPSRVLSGAWCVSNEEYEVSGKLLPFSGRETEWSAWLAVTTPDVGIGTGELGPTLRNMLDQFGLQLRDLNEQMMLSSSLGAAQDLANWDDRKYVLNKIVATAGEIKAAYTQAILALADEVEGAYADVVEAVETLFGDVETGVLLRMNSYASPGGGWARLGFETRATMGDVWSTAALYMESKTDGSSRIVLRAGSTYILDDDDNVLAAFTGDGEIDYARIPMIEADKIDVDSIFAADAAVSGTLTIGDNIIIDGPNDRILITDD